MKSSLKKVLRKTKGITVVTLVITIIVLLILAGVSISLVFNSEGLFSKTNESVSGYNESKQNELDYLIGVMNDIDKYSEMYEGGETPSVTQTVKPSPTPIKQPTIEIQGETTKYMAEDGEWWIPKRFKEAEYSPVTIKAGKVIQDEVGNEWVWIPCYLADDTGKEVGKEMYEEATEYKRTDFGKQNGSYLDYNETLEPTNPDVSSIKKYGGFYIGRYETGATTSVTSEDTSRKVLIQKDKIPYNYIKLTDCIAKSNSFANDNNYDTNKVYTKLVSSYAWDTAICFIQKTVTDYATNSPQGNYEDHKFSASKGRLNTGKTTPVCNIYDMGGNLWENTTELNSGGRYNYVSRGTSYNYSASGGPAGFRSYSDGGSYSDDTFRPTLYLL